MPDKPVASPSISSSTRVPQPSIVAPVREKPSTVFAPEDTINPAASDSPPDADRIVASPSISIWNPATGVSVLK